MQAQSGETAHFMNSRNAHYWLLASFAVLCLLLVPWSAIGASWRECDTQSMARSLAFEDFDVLHPRVNWRGDTDGSVEAEMPVYQALTALTMRWCGDVEWPGRAWSLLATLVGGLALHRLLRSSTGSPGAASAGLAAYLVSGSVVLTSCRVMPDALSVALCLIGLAMFDRMLRGGRPQGWLWVGAMVCTVFGCLAKPTSLQVVAIQFGWLLALAPRQIRNWRVLAVLVVPTVLTMSWMLHAASIGAETGLTFGVLRAGDSKLPHLKHLLAPGLFVGLAWTAVQFGPGVAGCASFLGLAVRRRFVWLDLAVTAPVVLALIATLRYSSSGGMGPHYHQWAAVAGAWFVARWWSVRNGPLTAWLICALVVVTAVWSFARERSAVRTAASASILEVASDLQAATKPGELVVVRSPKQRVDDYWQRRNNYEDPVVLYHARRFGWVIPSDEFTPDVLAVLLRDGAKAIVDFAPDRVDDATREWLAAHTTLVGECAGGRVLRVNP